MFNTDLADRYTRKKSIASKTRSVNLGRNLELQYSDLISFASWVTDCNSVTLGVRRSMTTDASIFWNVTLDDPI
jgi:hypothetical protein